MLPYTGPPELTPARVVTEWTPDVPTLLLVLLLGGAYWLGVRRVRAGGGSWPVNRVLAFGAGVVLLALIGCSFLGVYSDVLFWVRAAQNMLSLMVVPLLLALAHPCRWCWPRYRDRWRGGSGPSDGAGCCGS